VCRRLVGDDVEALAAARQLGLDLSRIAGHGDRSRHAGSGRFAGPGQRLVEVVRDPVHIAALQSPLDLLRVDLDAQRHAIIHGHRERLCSAHATEAGSEHDTASERALEVPSAKLREGPIGALQDVLAADVDPRSCCHLAVHREAGPFQLPEGLPRRPASHQVAVGDEDPGCPLVRAEHRDRLARWAVSKAWHGRPLGGPRSGVC
jgi:hypothetical protein